MRAGATTLFAIHSFALLAMDKNANIWGRACLLGFKFFLPLCIQENFPHFKRVCVRKLKTELMCNLKISPITARPGCETKAALKELEIEMSEYQ